MPMSSIDVDVRHLRLMTSGSVDARHRSARLAAGRRAGVQLLVDPSDVEGHAMLTDAAPVAGAAAHAVTVALAPPRDDPLCWRVVGRSRAGARLKDRQEASWLIRLATMGAVAYAAGLPLLQLNRIATAPIDQGRAGYAAAATLLCLPVQVWLVWSAARDVWERGQRWALAAMAVLILAMVPLAGFDGLGAVYVLAALVLITLRPPWSLLGFASLAVTPAAVAVASGHQQWASYFTLGVLLAAVPLAVVVSLIRAARQLQAARSALAQQAVIRERLRIDAELRQTVGAALEAITSQGDRALALADGDPPTTAQELAALVGAARRTLAAARRMVTRYQEVSLRAELETTAALLAAAGIQARLVLPPEGPPDRLDQAARAMLRRDLARLLSRESALSVVTITVVCRDRGVQVELRPDRTDPAATGMTAG
jgi:two-component system, NarL family, sensor histidine kinase DesK